MPQPLIFRYRLSNREFAQAWLGEYYLAPGRGCLRVAAGPLLVALGLVLRVAAQGGFVEGLGALCIGYGLFCVLRPLVAVSLLMRKRRDGRAAETTVELSDEGVKVTAAGSSASLGWDAIRRAGRRSGGFWLESRSGVRWSLPLRAVSDETALVQLLEERGKWQR